MTQTMAAAAAGDRRSRYLLALAALGFLASAWLGLVASIVSSWPGHFVALDFARLRPLHTFFALAATACGLTGLLLAVFGGVGIRAHRHDLRFPSLLAFVVAGGIGAGLGYTSGREYVSWWPLLTPLLLLPLLLNAAQILSNVRALMVRSPEGFWLIATGSVFICLGIVESHLWLLPRIGGDVVIDLTLQWQGLDLLFAGNNIVLYGCALYLISPAAKPLRSGWLFAVAAVTLLFTFGHHHYISPQPQWLKHMAVIASMLAMVSFLRHARAYRASAAATPGPVTVAALLLRSVERWALVSFATGIAFAVPWVNLVVHGTHLIVAHAMAGMIGVDFLLVIAGGLAATVGREAPASRRARLGVRLVDGSLIALWAVLGGAGVAKGLLRFSHEFAAYQPTVQLWLRAFPVVGLVLLVGIGLLCAELLRACRMRLRTPLPLSGEATASPGPSTVATVTRSAEPGLERA